MKTSLFSGICKPEYIFNPKQIARRLLVSHSNKIGKTTQKLPWGFTIQFNPNEVIGNSILRLGVYELAITEIIYRLSYPGANHLDIGANIGYMTSVICSKIQKHGKVICFEAHPDIYNLLAKNVNYWKDKNQYDIKLVNKAVSSSSGNVQLYIPDYFDKNNGTASLEKKDDYRTINIEALSLDDINVTESIELMKIDVEGHELEVFKGATTLLSNHRIKHIIFEDEHLYPNENTKFLEGFGYKVFRIGKTLFGPRISQPEKLNINRTNWEPQNYLATVDPLYAEKIINQEKGWKVLNLDN